MAQVLVLDPHVGAPVYTPPSPPLAAPGKTSLSGGAIAGIVVGILAFLAILAALALIATRKESLQQSSAMLAYTYNDPRMITWHNHLANVRQANAGGGFQHFLTPPSVGAGVPVSQDAIDLQMMEGNDKALAHTAAAGQTYAQ